MDKEAATATAQFHSPKRRQRRRRWTEQATTTTIFWALRFGRGRFGEGLKTAKGDSVKTKSITKRKGKTRPNKTSGDARAVLRFLDGLTRAKCGNDVVNKIARKIRRQRPKKNLLQSRGEAMEIIRRSELDVVDATVKAYKALRDGASEFDLSSRPDIAREAYLQGAKDALLWILGNGNRLLAIETEDAELFAPAKADEG